MKYTVALLLFLLINVTHTAQSIMFTPEETGIMFHAVQKSNALKRTIGEHFNYKGDTVFFKHTIKGTTYSVVDYDSITQQIVYEPALLQINYYGLSEESTGILAELASKMALYKLYKDLKNRKNTSLTSQKDNYYHKFIDTLVLNLPQEVIRKKNGKDEPIPEIWELLDPNFFFNQRVTALSSIQTLKQQRQKDVLDAINKAIWSYLQAKSEDYFKKLSRQSRGFTTTVIACGDGSNTTGLLEENEKIYKQKNELGDNVGVGLFTYESKFVSSTNNRQILTPFSSSIIKLQSFIDEYTTLHFSLWGFNSNKQTTVAVYNENKMYLLYANKLTKELSPDSTFGNGSTIHTLIRTLENETIPKQLEILYGKEGIQSKLNFKDTSHKDVMYKIATVEMNLTNYRYDIFKNKKKIKADENLLAKLYARKTELEKQKAILTLHLKTEEDRLARYRARLFELQSYLGYTQINYTRLGYVYTFEDGCTFNAFTQNFTIPDTLGADKVFVRLIAIGHDAMSEKSDEVQLLTSVAKGVAEDFKLHSFTLEFFDHFDVDSYVLKPLVFNPEKHFEITKLLFEILRKKATLAYHLYGNGTGVLVDGKVMKSNSKELDAYPGENDEERSASKESEAFKPLRYSSLSFSESNNILNLTIESFTDPVKSNFSKKNPELSYIKKELNQNTTDNMILSVFRSFNMAEQFSKEMAYVAYFNFKGKERLKLLDEIKQTLQKSKCMVNGASISYKQYTAIANGKEDYMLKCIETFKSKEAEELKLLEM